MAVKFNVVERGNPAKQTDPKKFYPSIVSTGKVKMRQLVKRITEMSTVSSADAMAVVEALLVIIPSELGAGNIVDLGDFGAFWLRVKSEGADSADKVRADSVTGILPRFVPGVEFKKALKDFNFIKA